MLAEGIFSIFGSNFDGAIKLSFRSLAMKCMAGVALAIRLYQIDHGRRPATLAELLPKYLPKIPTDPFSPEGKPIGYQPNLPQPVLYSVSVNGIDENGQYELDSEKYVDWEAKDYPFFLNGDRPEPVNP